MRPTRNDLNSVFRDLEQKHSLKPGTLFRIYQREADVVFLGKRRNILKNLRGIAADALAEDDDSAD
jgi:hypothetical protein